MANEATVSECGPPGEAGAVLEEFLRLPWAGKRVGVRFRLTGSANSPLVLVLGGINASRDPGDWWPEQTGPGKPLDPARYRLLGIDWLESHSERPPATHDQARALEQVLAYLELNRLDLVVGASYGAMVGLALAERRQVVVDHLLVISAAHYSHPAATASRILQREILRFAHRHIAPDYGLALARGLALLGYRTPEIYARRFPQDEAEARMTEIRSYLAHAGRDFARRFSVRGFLNLSESLDRHEVRPGRIDCPTSLVAVDSDQLVPFSQMQELAEEIPNLIRFQQLESIYGHDAFLTEHQAVQRILLTCLKEIHREEVTSEEIRHVTEQ